ncbi:MAG: hypothetical protein KC464_20580, partial [Myxococcales bacterium]|nr:hypothetical protein [Myxococcales bacterium]
MAYDAARQRVVLFGGYNGTTTSGQLADTWEWNGVSWLQRSPATSPSERSGHAMAYDELRQQVTLYGGWDGTFFDDTWLWTGSDWQLATANGPGARDGHAMAYDRARNRLVVFGGSDGVGLLSGTSINGAPPVIATATAYGTGCGSPALGLEPDPANPPLIGSVARATIVDSPTPIAGVTLGWSNDFFGPFVLPVTLSGIGLTGCDLLHSAEVIGEVAAPLTATTLTYGLALPDQPSLAGVHIFVQAYAFAPGANPAQIVMSNAIDWQIGDVPAPTPLPLVETFSDASGQEAEVSAGTWGGVQGPGARPGLIGGDGRHGSFDPNGGYALGGDVFEFNTSSMTLFTENGPVTVTDGRFYFTDFVVPSGITVRFTGPVPPIVSVSGVVDIQGTIEVNGADMPFFVPTTGPAAGREVSTWNATTATGMPGTAGGCGGGDGGDGAAKCLNAGPIFGAGGVPLTDGQPGEDVRVLAGHAYAASVAGTGGRGGLMTPASGIWPLLPSSQLISNIYVPYFSTGGSGGGYVAAGGAPVSMTV